jgi:hypothetical protein
MAAVTVTATARDRAGHATTASAVVQVLVPGTYEPAPELTGIQRLGKPVGLVTTPLTAAANTAYTQLDFTDWVTVNAANVTFNRCRFRGKAAGDYTKWLVNCSGTGCSNVVFNDCTFEPVDHTKQFAGGVGGHDFTLNRCRFIGCTDSIDPFNLNGTTLNVAAYGCLAEALDGFYPDAQHSDGSHCDNCQPTGGSGLTLVGNKFTGLLSATPNSQATPYWPQANASIQTNQNQSRLTDVLIDRNWFDGGSIAAINISSVNASTYGYPTRITVTNNRFGRAGRVAAQVSPMTHVMKDWAIIANPAVYSDPANTFTGNVYADDGTSVVLHNGA